MGTLTFQIVFCTIIILLSILRVLWYRKVETSLKNNKDKTWLDAFYNDYLDYKEIGVIVSTLIICGTVIVYPKEIMEVLSIIFTRR
jgi:hypothetical protein